MIGIAIIIIIIIIIIRDDNYGSTCAWNIADNDSGRDDNIK